MNPYLSIVMGIGGDLTSDLLARLQSSIDNLNALARKVSVLRSAGLMSIFSTASTSGRIATVQAEVWMRPCASVAGTR